MRCLAPGKRRSCGYPPRATRRGAVRPSADACHPTPAQLWNMGGPRRRDRSRRDPRVAAIREAEEEIGLPRGATLGSNPSLAVHEEVVTMDHAGWKYTTLIADVTREFQPRITDFVEGIAVEWVPVADVSGRNLFEPFREAWPGLLARIQSQAASSAPRSLDYSQPVQNSSDQPQQNLESPQRPVHHPHNDYMPSAASHPTSPDARISTLPQNAIQAPTDIRIRIVINIRSIL